MIKVNHFLLVLFLLVLNSTAFAVPVSYKETPEIKKAATHWEVAIDERNPEKIVALYDKDAFLHATFSNFIEDRAAMLAYFTKLTKRKNLKVKFIKEHIRVYGDVAINSGAYVFSYIEKGKIVNIPGRYTFVYHHTPEGWMIVDHHSSVMPEK